MCDSSGHDLNRTNAPNAIESWARAEGKSETMSADLVHEHSGSGDACCGKVEAVGTAHRRSKITVVLLLLAGLLWALW